MTKKDKKDKKNQKDQKTRKSKDMVQKPAQPKDAPAPTGEKWQFTFRDVWYPTVVLTLICLVCAFLLGATYEVTEPLIRAREDEKEVALRQEVFPDAARFGETTKHTMKDCEGTVTPALDEDGDVIGYVISGEGKGYGGTVSILVGLDLEGTIIKARPLILNETAGLGMRAENPDFLAQYTGQTSPVKVVKKDPGKGEIQAITGATITTNAVTQAVNHARSIFEDITRDNTPDVTQAQKEDSLHG